MATILVTGAAGFIGSHTCDLLLAEGHRVVGVDDFRTGRPENLAEARGNPAFSLHEFDVAEPPHLAEVVAQTGPDAVIHLAALVNVPQSVADPALNFRQNVEATQRVLEAVRSAPRPNDRRARTTRIVFASSAAVYGDNPELPLTERSQTRPISPYGAAKLASEALLMGEAAAFGLAVRCLRYFNVYGPRQDPKSPYSGVISIFCDRVRAGKAPTVFGDGEQTRDFISVRDVARANMIASTAPRIGSGVVNICTGKPTSLNELAAVLGRCFGADVRPLYGEPRAGDIRHSLGSPDRARRELGFEARVSLEAGLRETEGGRVEIGKDDVAKLGGSGDLKRET